MPLNIGEFIMFAGSKEEKIGYEKLEASNHDKFSVERSLPVEVSLPCEYGEDCVVLMAIDPYWVFSYWEISAATEKEFMEKLGDTFQGAEIRLLIHELSHDAREQVVNTISIPVKMRIGNWYLYLGAPLHLFQGEIGYLLSDGTFVSLAQSNYIELPPDNISDKVDSDWLIVEEDFTTMGHLIKKELTGSSSLESYIIRPEFMRQLKERLEKEGASHFLFSSALKQ